MTPFEYISVLISIILGLGITLVLTGIADLIKRWESVTLFWPYLIWIALVFVLHIHEWWIMYDLRTMSSWQLVTFLFVILYPILLFILANLLFPIKWPKGKISLKDFYFHIYPKFFACAIALVMVAIVSDVVIAGRTFLEQLVKGGVLIILLILYVLRPKRVWIHSTLTLLFLMLMIISLIVQSDQLVIR
jgi:hypothetical protein